MAHSNIFFSQPLIAVSSTPEEEERYRGFYSDIVAVCERRHFTVYSPYEQGNSVKHDFISESAIYDINRTHIVDSAVLVAYVGLPSAGVAMGIEIANGIGIPVILLYEEQKRDQVSKMVRGCPAARYQVQAPSLAQLVTKFDGQFDAILAQIAAVPTLPAEDDRSVFRSLLRQLREESGFSFDQVAERAMLDRPYVWRVFRGDIQKPGRNQVVKLCVYGLALDLEQTNTVLNAGGYEPL